MRRPKTSSKRWTGTLGLLAALLLTSACDVDLPGASPTATPVPPAAAAAPSPTATSGPQLVPAPTALPSGLPQLLVRPVPFNLPSYDRDDWRHWIDDDGDCQNARHEALVAESRIAVTFTDEDRCTVATGEWLDPYTGDILTSAPDLDVDHMVPLANAHRSGAWDWDAARRLAYANDLTYANHLIAVTSSVNRAKSDSGPEEWRPPDQSYWCQYAIDWATIKADWGLSATPAEWDALLEMAATCGDELPPSLTHAAPNRHVCPRHDGLRLMQRSRSGRPPPPKGQPRRWSGLPGERGAQRAGWGWRRSRLRAVKGCARNPRPDNYPLARPHVPGAILGTRRLSTRRGLRCLGTTIASACTALSAPMESCQSIGSLQE